MIELFLSLAVYNLTANEIMEKADDNLGKVGTISGELERKVESPQDTEKISGLFYFKTPDKLRLNFSAPDYEEIAINGKTFTDYKPGRKEYTVRELPDSVELDNSFLGLKQSEFEYFRGRFSFDLKWQGDVKGNHVYLLEGKVPSPAKGPAQANGAPVGLSKVLVWIDQSRFVPLRLETYSAGQYPTTIYQVDSLSFLANRFWQPVRYRLFLGIDKGTIAITSRLGRLKVDEEIPEATFDIPAPGKR